MSENKTPWEVRDEQGVVLSRHATGNEAVDAMCGYPEGKKLDVVMVVSGEEWDWLQDLLAEDEQEVQL
jgi:hypothetical protein